MPQSPSTRLILEVGQAVLAADGLEATIQIILEGARRLTGAETVGLVQPDPTDDVLRCTHAVGRDVEALRSLPPVPVGHGVADLSPDHCAALDRLNSRSVLAAPLLVNGVARGALVAYDSAPARFSETIGELLATLASLAGVALENVRLHEETRVRAIAPRSSPRSRASSARRSTCRACCRRCSTRSSAPFPARPAASPSTISQRTP